MGSAVNWENGPVGLKAVMNDGRTDEDQGCRLADRSCHGEDRAGHDAGDRHRQHLAAHRLPLGSSEAEPRLPQRVRDGRMCLLRAEMITTGSVRRPSVRPAARTVTSVGAASIPPKAEPDEIGSKTRTKTARPSMP